MKLRRKRADAPLLGPSVEVLVEVEIEVASIDGDSTTIRVHMGPKTPEVTLAEGERVKLRLVGYTFDESAS